MVDGYKITTDIGDMNIPLIHNFISQSYWAKGMPIKLMTKAIENSLCFAILDDGRQQVGFARMVTDRATFAYLADVFVLEDHRGKGLSKWLVQHILEHSQLQGLRRMMLATSDAHALYEKFGFKALTDPKDIMEIRIPNVYT